MTRHVYLDPFGSYTRGYDQGNRTEMATQLGARQAAAQDFQLHEMDPLKLAAAQRADKLGRATLPYQIQLAPYALKEAKANWYDHALRQGVSGAEALGIPNLIQNVMYRHFGISPHVAPNGDTTYYMQGPNGEAVPVSHMPAAGQHVLDYFDRPWELQQAQLQQRDAYYHYLGQNAAAQRQYLYNTIPYKYPGAYGHTGESVFGVYDTSPTGTQPNNDPFSGQRPTQPQDGGPARDTSQYGIQ